MEWLKDMATMVRLKALLDQHLTKMDIVALTKTEGREAVLAMGEEELKRQEKKE